MSSTMNLSSERSALLVSDIGRDAEGGRLGGNTDSVTHVKFSQEAGSQDSESQETILCYDGASLEEDSLERGDSREGGKQERGSQDGEEAVRTGGSEDESQSTVLFYDGDSREEERGLQDGEEAVRSQSPVLSRDGTDDSGLGEILDDKEDVEETRKALNELRETVLPKLAHPNSKTAFLNDECAAEAVGENVGRGTLRVAGNGAVHGAGDSGGDSAGEQGINDGSAEDAVDSDTEGTNSVLVAIRADPGAFGFTFGMRVNRRAAQRVRRSQAKFARSRFKAPVQVERVREPVVALSSCSSSAAESAVNIEFDENAFEARMRVHGVDLSSLTLADIVLVKNASAALDRVNALPYSDENDREKMECDTAFQSLLYAVSQPSYDSDVVLTNAVLVRRKRRAYERARVFFASDAVVGICKAGESHAPDSSASVGGSVVLTAQISHGWEDVLADEDSPIVREFLTPSRPKKRSGRLSPQASTRAKKPRHAPSRRGAELQFQGQHDLGLEYGANAVEIASDNMARERQVNLDRQAASQLQTVGRADDAGTFASAASSILHSNGSNAVSAINLSRSDSVELIEVLDMTDVITSHAVHGGSNAGQIGAIQTCVARKAVCVAGLAGAGKSWVKNRVADELLRLDKDLVIFEVGPTALSVSDPDANRDPRVRACTIHEFTGIGIESVERQGDESQIEVYIRLLELVVSRSDFYAIKKRVTSCDVLLLEEVFMQSAAMIGWLNFFLNALTSEAFLRHIVTCEQCQKHECTRRRCKLKSICGVRHHHLCLNAANCIEAGRYFGGKKICCFGDPGQLAPFSSLSNQVKYVFQARLWKAAGFAANTCSLVESVRQNEANFVRVLNSLRLGRLSSESIEVLVSRDVENVGSPNRSAVTIMTSTNGEARDIADARRRDLVANGSDVATDVAKVHRPPGTLHPQEKIDVARMERQFASRREMTKEMAEREKMLVIRNSYVTVLKKENGIYVVDEDACSKGRDGRVKIVNGDLCEILTGGFVFKKGHFDAAPKLVGLKVVMLSGEQRGAYLFLERTAVDEVACTSGYASVQALPVTCGEAITVHKSQGMTLDGVLFDLKTAWARGQAYTALSRARFLRTLYLKNTRSLVEKAKKGKLADPRAVNYILSLQSQDR